MCKISVKKHVKMCKILLERLGKMCYSMNITKDDGNLFETKSIV